LSDKTREALLIFLDAVDAATTQLRQNLSAETKPSPALKFDASKIMWKKAMGDKGEFEIAEKQANNGNPD